ncbi:MAG: phosphopentomutase [Desulfuromonadaceae bacterium]|nr:phosphopentomutase [Geobacteraceae bacterium]
MSEFNRVVLIVLDGAGCGAMPDAVDFGDAGPNTLKHVADVAGPLKLPMLEQMGLGNIVPLSGVPACATPLAAWGRMAERSAAKDSTTGHWEMAGVVMQEPFRVYADGFPPEIIHSFTRIAGIEPLGNIPASGTEIIQHLGPEHMCSGRPIVYTSTDSVFQIAAHEDVIPVARLYDICAEMRDVLDLYRVGRVIARPFAGNEQHGYVRTTRRRDFSMPPPQPTMLDMLQEHNIEVGAVGKISDIFCGRGIDLRVSTASNAEGMKATQEHLQQMERGLLFTNLIDFDMMYGHRRDSVGFAGALQELDIWLGEFLSQLRDSDLLIITADHGCDPTMPGTDHTREYVPLLVYTPRIQEGADLGARTSFADISATILQNFALRGSIGVSFLQQLSAG